MSNIVEIKKENAIFQAFEKYNKPYRSACIDNLAKKAEIKLEGLSFPNSKTEYWKYTRVNKITNSHFSFQKYENKIDLTPFLIPGLDCHTMVFVNGYYREDLSCHSLEEGLVLSPISEIENNSLFEDKYGQLTAFDDAIFASLNTAFPSDGVMIVAHKDAQISKPIHLIFLASMADTIAQPRNLFIAQQGAKINVIVSEFSLDDHKSFSNGITEIFIDKNASFSLDLIQKYNDKSFLLNQIDVKQNKDSKFNINTLTSHGGWVRNNLNIQVQGENCETHLNGTYSPKGKSHVDNHTVVDHLVPHCESHELYKGIVYDQATAVFNGKVFVRPNAQLTNAYQQNANILMSDSATVDSKPELEIYADDVKCSHGSTIGQFDEDALFYLMARGISKENAKKILVNAFVGDVIGKISDVNVREYVEDLF